MNRLLAKISLATAATAIGAFGFSAAVLAEEGGVAGAAAFTINDAGAVTGVAVAAAVGKRDDA